MPEEIVEKVYTPADVEEKWIAFWERHHLFHATLDREGTESFSMVIPPPNVTGSLHLGHALNTTLQDILARWKRMQGFNVLWVPGTDHAGIATQNVVERQLAKEGVSRHDIGRDPFVEKIWDWKEKSGGTIISQLKRLGASCDFRRERFTLDEGLSSAVTEVFVRLYQEGLIYRAERLINFCFRCNTALSDIEVEHEEIMGKMYHIRYPLVDGSDFLTVATTRPETMLADMAVAVHPDDPRYNKFIGKEVRLPLTSRTIPIVGDAILVDRAFGTGAVKITPGHDFNDEQAGKRHQLEPISLLDYDGKINGFTLLMQAKVELELAKEITSKSLLEARKIAVKWLEDKQWLVKEDDHRHAVGVCYRCKTVVEPYQSTQWFVKMNDPQNSLAKPAIEAVVDGRIRLIPENWKNNYLGWMENIQDWCISRQIWWGHPIPAWYCQKCDPDSLNPIVQQEQPTTCSYCGSTRLTRDPDVLDTWFSSALWPFSTLGWPQETALLKQFYPTTTLISGFDILFFWVARMIMMGLHFTKEVPFRDVYIHALVRDAEGKKMSKSKGNVIDPLDVMSRYGTDALRFTLASMASPGRDIRLSEERIEGYRNFANKIWNSFRFIEMNLSGKSASSQAGSHIRDRWITNRLHRTIHTVNVALKNYRFDDAANTLYQFTWHEFCDWYLEFVKIDLQEGDDTEGIQTALSLFEVLLKLLHPFMPFITEELWSRLKNHRGGSISVTAYPESDDRLADCEAEEAFSKIIHLITAIRNLRGEMNIAPSEILNAQICPHDERAQTFFNQYLPYIKRLARLSVVSVEVGLAPPKMAATIPTDWGEIYIHLSEARLEKEITRLQKALQQMDLALSKIEEKHANPHFITSAPKEVVGKSVQKRAQIKEERAKADAHLQRFCNMIVLPEATSPKKGDQRD